MSKIVNAMVMNFIRVINIINLSKVYSFVCNRLYFNDYVRRISRTALKLKPR